MRRPTNPARRWRFLGELCKQHPSMVKVSRRAPKSIANLNSTTAFYPEEIIQEGRLMFRRWIATGDHRLPSTAP